MNPNWRSFLEAAEGLFAPQTIPHAAILESFGDQPAELVAAATRTVVAPLTHLGVIEVTGDDAASFLHNQLTSDVHHLQADRAQHAAWCSAKGRMLASFVVIRHNEGYWLVCAADLLEPTLKRLQMFVLRSRVKLAARTDSHAILGVSGPQSAEALADAGLPCPPSLLDATPAGDSRIVALDASRYILVLNGGTLADTWQKLTAKARPVGVPAWHWLDVRAGYPIVTLATREEFVPQMADFEKMGGVSFHKGCYPGQEVVARTQYLGKVKRHLFRVSCQAPLVAGDELYSPDNLEQAAGKVITAAPDGTAGFVGLAVAQAGFAGSLHRGARDGKPVQATAVNPG